MAAAAAGFEADPLVISGTSLSFGVPGGTPLGLFDAADAARCLDGIASPLDTAELRRARAETGRTAVGGGGTGELRPTFAGSGNVPTRGEEVTDGEARFVLLFRSS